MNTDPHDLQPRSPADVRLGLTIVVALTAIWIIGDFHSRQDSDSLIHSLNSLYRWTVFVWEYDHNGSLLSALASGITRPYWNVLAISTLSSLLFLSGLILWAALIAPVSLTEGGIWAAFLLPVLFTQHAVFQIASQSVTSGVALFFSGMYACLLQQYLQSNRRGRQLTNLLPFAFLATFLSKIAFFPIAAVTLGLLWTHRPLPWRTLVIICS
jgi:hypothetical protein